MRNYTMLHSIRILNETVILTLPNDTKNNEIEYQRYEVVHPEIIFYNYEQEVSIVYNSRDKSTEYYEYDTNGNESNVTFRTAYESKILLQN